MKRLLACLTCAFTAAGGSDAEVARACSCARVDTRSALREADAAFIGTVVGKVRVSQPPGSVNRAGEEFTYTFRVERSFKRRLGDGLQLTVGSDGGSCGFELRVGERIGALLYRDGRGYDTGLCGLRSPAALLRATRPFPRPRGAGRLSLLAAGDFGSAGLLALDASGRILGYGFGRGTITALSVCPGGRHVAEVVAHRRGTTLRIRRLRDLRIVRAHRLTSDPRSVRCSDGAARRVYAFFTNEGATDGPTRGRLVVLAAAGARTLRRAPDSDIVFTRFFAYVTEGERGLVRVGLRSGRAERIARLPPASYGYTASPDGRALAGLTRSGAVLVELSGRPRVRTRRFPGSEGRREPVWLDNGRIAYIDEYGGRPRAFDRWLHPRRSLRSFWGISPVVLGGRLLALQDSTVRSMRLRDGRRRDLTELPSETAELLRAVTARPLVRISRRRPANLTSAGRPCGPRQSS